jgi:dihydropteroate synthase
MSGEGPKLKVQGSRNSESHSFLEPQVTWRLRGENRDLAKQGLIMGVLNVTPDSFSDGGQFLDHAKAVAHGLAMVAEGAEIIDVGGESTRPGASPVTVEEEMRRVLPVIEQLRIQSKAYISVDTMKPEVARSAVAAGADIINDVSGFRNDEMLQVAAQSNAAIVVMHMLGEPRTMQQSPVYENVTREVRSFFESQLRRMTEAGIKPECIAFDPGFGFGKTLEHNLQLLRELPALRIGNRPLVVGVSRKSMIGKLLSDTTMAARQWPTVALTAWLRDAGAEVIRVHEVKANVEALRMIEAING